MKSEISKASADRLVKTIRRKIRQTYSAEEKIRIVLAGLRGKESISALCHREGIAQSLYYSWSKWLPEAELPLPLIGAFSRHARILSCNESDSNSSLYCAPDELGRH